MSQSIDGLARAVIGVVESRGPFVAAKLNPEYICKYIAADGTLADAELLDAIVGREQSDLVAVGVLYGFNRREIDDIVASGLAAFADYTWLGSAIVHRSDAVTSKEHLFYGVIETLAKVWRYDYNQANRG